MYVFVRYNLVASHLTGARRGPDSITAECAKKMNTTFEIEEVSSDFFSALENAELCHGVNAISLWRSRVTSRRLARLAPPRL